MADSIDKLSIEITSSTDDAQQSISKLTEMLKKLSNSLRGLDGGSELKAVAQSADSAGKAGASAAKSMGETAKAATRVKKELSNVKVSLNLSAVNRQLADFRKKVMESTVLPQAKKEGLANMAKEYVPRPGVADESAAKAAKIRLQFAEEALEEQLELAKTSSMSKEAEARAAEDAKEAARKAEERAQAYRDAAKAMHESMPKTAYQTMPGEYYSRGERYRITDYLPGGRRYGQNANAENPVPENASASAEHASSAFDRLKSVVGNLKEGFSACASHASGLVPHLKSAASAGGHLALSLGGAALRGMHAFNMEIAKGLVQKLRQGLNSVASGAKRAAIGIAGVAKQLITMPLKSFGNRVSENVGKASNSMRQGLRFVMRYILGFRALFYMMRQLRGATADAFTNLAHVSSQTNANLSLLSSGLAQLKNSLASAFDPILTVITPILSYFISMLVAALNAVGQFFAALTGQSTWHKATFNMADFAASADNSAASSGRAADAAEKLKKSLMGFDKINKLDEPDSSSNGGGGGGGAGGAGGANYGDMFSTETVSTGISNFAQMVKDAWANSDFTAVGDLIGTKLAEALNSIPWDTVKQQAKGFGMSFATLLNGLLESKIDVVGDGKHWKTLGQILGKTIGEVVNVGLEGWEGFVDKLHFDSIGAFIADGMNELTITVDWIKLADNLAKTANGVFTAADTWSKKFDFEALGTELGKAVKRVFNKFDFSIFESNLTNFGSGLANFLKGFFASNPLTAVGTAIGDALSAVLSGANSFLKDLPTGAIGEDLAGALNGIFGNKTLFENLASTVSGTANSVLNIAATWSGKFKFGKMGSSIRTAITDTLDNLNWNDAETAAGNIATGIATALNNIMTADTFKSVGTAIAGGINTAVTGIYNFVTGISWTNWAKNLSAGINQFFDDIKWEQVGITFTSIGTALGKSVNAAITGGYTLIGRIEWENWGKTVGTAISNYFTTIDWGKLGITFTAAVNGLLSGLKGAIEGIDFESVGKGLVTALANVDWTLLFDKAAKLLGSVSIAFGNFVQGLLEGFGEAIVKWFEENVPKEIRDFFANIQNSIEWLTGLNLGTNDGSNYGQQTIKEGGEGRSVNVTVNGKKGTGYEYIEGYNAAQDGSATKTAKGKKEKTFTDLSSAWVAWTDQNVKKSLTAEESKKYTESYDKFDKWVDEWAKKNLTAGQAVDYTTLKKAWDEWDNEDAKKTLVSSFKDKKAWDSNKKTWGEIPAQQTATKKIVGEKADSFKTISSAWEMLPSNQTATKKIAGEQANSFGSIKKAWDYFPHGKTTTHTSTKKLAGEESNSFKNVTKAWNVFPNGPSGHSSSSHTSTKKLAGDEADTFKNAKKDWEAVPTTHTSTKKFAGDQQDSFTSGKKAFNSVPTTTTSTLKLKAVRASGLLSALGAMVAAAAGSWTTANNKASEVPSEKMGGVFFGGAWHKFAQYAAGGIPTHGTVFVAGEAGAEAVGHIGGRTEVLNQSQMASVMYDAVVRGMVQAMSIAGRNGTEVHVHLDGDAGKMFRVVQREANNYTQTTGRPAFNI